MVKTIRREVFESYPEAQSALARELNKREFSPDEYYVVLCPDRYTLAVEQALFCRGDGRGGAMDLEVLTLSRLSRRVAPAAKTLSQEGGIMITARAIAAVKDRLSYYDRAADFNDFAREVYATIQQITASDANIAEIEANGATKLKLDDLALIKSEYDKIKDDCADASDKLYSLISAAPTSKFIKDTHFFAIGYSDATKLITRVFSGLAKSAKSFALYDVPPSKDRREALDLFCAPDSIIEYKRVAVEIRDYVDNGGDYEDVAVVCNDPRALKRILGEYEIPTYTDESKPLLCTPPLAVIDNIYKLYDGLKEYGRIDCSALVALAQNPYVGCDRMQAETLLYEVSTRALARVSDKFEFTGDGDKAAKHVFAVLKEFSACHNFGEAVSRVLQLCDFEGVQRAQGAGTDVVKPIIGLIELLGRYGSGDFKVDAKAFLSAARAVNVNTLPRERHCVTVTVPSALRMMAVKKLFITDFNEGVMPTAIADTGLISDAELDMLGGVIEPTCLKRNRQSRDELKAVVQNAGSVFITYTSAGGSNGGVIKRAVAVKLGDMVFKHAKKPAYFKRRRTRDGDKGVVIDADRIFDGKYLKRKRAGDIGKPATFIVELAEKIRVYESAKTDDALLKTQDPLFIAKHAPVPAAAREIVARQLTRHAASVDGATEKCKAVYAPFDDRIKISHKSTLSGSEITNWFYCPYKRFLRNTVELAERKHGVGANDLGTVLHYFMQEFLGAKPPYDCSEAAVKIIVDKVLKDNGVELDDATYGRFLASAKDFAQVNVNILRKGEGKDKQKYNVAQSEYDKLGGKTLGNKAKFKFSGRIDRYDLCGNRARIIDYKTGDKTFNIGQCLDGRDMQLPLYAYALKDDYDVTGMFYVRNPKRYYTEDPKEPMSGIMIRDKEIVDEYEVLGAEEKSTIICSLKTKKDGTLGKSGTLLERDKFNALINACKKNADVAADEINDGFIVRSPADGACDYCQYIGICGGGTARVPDIDIKSILGDGASEIGKGDD